MSSAALSTAREKIDALKNRLSNARETHARTVERAVSVAVTGGAGAIFGGLEERFGEDAIMGASVPVVVGAPALALGLAGVGGEMASGVMLDVGKAAVAIESYKLGARITRDWLDSDDAEE